MIGRFTIIFLTGIVLIVQACSCLQQTDNSDRDEMRRRAVRLMEEIYQNISSTVNADHRKSIVELAKNSGFELTFLNMEKPVASIEEYEKKRTREGDAGRREFCMVRPVFSKSSCSECHQGKNRVLGLIDVCIDAGRL